MNNIKKYNCFALYGVELSLLIWIENTLVFFENENYPLKSISYDIDRSKLGRKSIATFLKDFDHHYESLSLTLFYGENQKKPSTWQYGVSYDRIIPNEKIDFVAKKFLEHQLLVGVSENRALKWQ